MQPYHNTTNRRHFMKTAAALTTGLAGLGGLTALAAPAPPYAGDLYVIGPMPGYSPHIGTLVSMLNYNRQTIINTVKMLTQSQLDYLHDPGANTIGALILHLGATEKFYQVNTFEGRQSFNSSEKKHWEAAMDLGDEGRRHIKGKDVQYYLERIAEVRQQTLEAFKQKDDDWLLAVDPEWSKERPLNTYWKWFHVCEHESNHRGQMTWLKSRLPGAKAGND